MSKNIKQIYDSNPASSLNDTDILYIGRSPYGNTNDMAINGTNLKASLIMPPQVVTTDTTMVTNTVYIANSSSLITFTLPTNCARGDKVKVIGIGTGLIKLLLNAGQSIHFGSLTSSLYVASTVQYSQIELTCIDASSLIFQVTDAVTLFSLDGGSSGVNNAINSQQELSPSGTPTFNGLALTNPLTMNPNGSIYAGAFSIASGAICQFDSTTKGVLLPRMNSTQRNAIVGSGQLILVDNTTPTASQFYFYNGSTWTALLQATSNLSDLQSATTARTNLGLGTAATQNSSAFLQPANNLSDVSNASTARTNLGLGTLATQSASNVSITGGSIITTQFSNNVITESTTARTLAVADAGATILTTNAGGNCVITIPTNATAAIPIGAQINIVNQQGTPRLTNISVSGGVTLIGNIPNVGNNGYFIIEKINTNTWIVVQEYESTTASINFSFGGATSGNQTVKLFKNNSTAIIQPPTFTITNAIPFTSSVTSLSALPTRFIPSQSHAVGGIIILDGNNAPCAYRIDNGGNFTYNNQDATNFTATQVIAITTAMTYLL